MSVDGLDGIDEWDESFLQEAMRIELEAVASRNLLTTVSGTAPAPQPPSVPSVPLASFTPQAMDIVRYDRSADVVPGITEVPFSPPRELSQRYNVGRPRAGDDFEMMDSWGDFGNTDSARKNNRELERLKRELMRVTMLLNHKESECSELHRDRAKKEEQLKYASEQIEAKETEIRILKRANVEPSTRLSSMNERMLSGTEHTPVPVQIPLPTMISTGGLKERKITHVPLNREDPMMASTPAVLESRHQTMNGIKLSTSKSIGVQTEYLQDGDINNNCSTTAKSLYEEQICSTSRATWDLEPTNRRTRSELMSVILASCSEDIIALFDDKEMSDASTSKVNCSRLGALLMKVHDQTAKVHDVVEELLSLCRVTNVSLVARSLKILRAIVHHLISSESFSNPRENVSVELSPTDIKQGKRRKNENSHIVDLCLFDEDSSFDKMTDLPSIWWVTIFDTAREAITKNPEGSSVSDALWIMIFVVMRSDVNTDREKFGLAPVIECVHLLLNKESESGPPPPTTTTAAAKPVIPKSESGPLVKKQAVYLLFLILNCPKTLALFCSGGKDGMDVILERTEMQSEDVLQHQIGLLLGDLGGCLSCPLSGSMELKLLRQVIILLAYIASYGKSGFELLLVPVVPTGLNLLELIVQVISAQMDLESSKERNLVMREALILLNRLASNPIYSKTTLEVLTRSKSCASLTIDIAIRIPRMGRGGPRTDNTHMELEIADLASVFSSRLFSFAGEK